MGEVVVEESVDTGRIVCECVEFGFDRGGVELVQGRGHPGQCVGKAGGEPWQGRQRVQAVETREQWLSGGEVHDAPRAVFVVCVAGGVDVWGWVSLRRDASLHDRLARGEISVGREAKHDPSGQVAGGGWGEAEGPHLGPEPAAEPPRCTIESKSGCAVLLAESAHDVVEFGGRVDVGDVVGNTHIDDRNSKCRQCLKASRNRRRRGRSTSWPFSSVCRRGPCASTARWA